VKPGNILVGRGDHTYLTDFGLIKRREEGTALTKTGQFMGSVDYAAPEQIEGKAVDGRADTYSLGRWSNRGGRVRSEAHPRVDSRQ
jgi:serine/threonine protein kinase